MILRIELAITDVWEWLLDKSDDPMKVADDIVSAYGEYNAPEIVSARWIEEEQ